MLVPIILVFTGEEGELSGEVLIESLHKTVTLWLQHSGPGTLYSQQLADLYHDYRQFLPWSLWSSSGTQKRLKNSLVSFSAVTMVFCFNITYGLGHLMK